MNKNVVIGVVALVILFGGYFFFKNVWVTSPNPAMGGLSGLKPEFQPGYVPGGAKELPWSGGNIMVKLTDSGYSPSTLTITKGATVTFKNESAGSMWTASAMHPAHTEYSGTSLSEHCPGVANTSFDACRGYAPGESWSFTFQKVGTWGYHNHLNPSQWGKIIVGTDGPLAGAVNNCIPTAGETIFAGKISEETPPVSGDYPLYSLSSAGGKIFHLVTTGADSDILKSKVGKNVQVAGTPQPLPSYIKVTKICI